MSIDTPPAGSAPSRPRLIVRSFSIALGLAFFVVAAVGFGPLQLAHLNGNLATSVVGELHGVLMVAWLLTFIAHAVVVANRRIDLHRRAGTVGIGLSAAVWLSVAGLTVRQLSDAAVPLDKRIDTSLPQLYVVSAFLPLFAMAIRRRRNPPWHKRLLAISTIALLQAVVDRFGPLPDMVTGYWAQALCLDALLVPLIVFDLTSLKRLHPATVLGSGLVLPGQSVVAVLWGSDWWPPRTVRLAHALQTVF